VGYRSELGSLMDRSRARYIHDNVMASYLRRYLCRTYDGTLPWIGSQLSIFQQRFDNSEGTDPERREGQSSPYHLYELDLETPRQSLRGGYSGEAVITSLWHQTYLHHDYGIGP
jgi:hypothetical protein